MRHLIISHNTVEIKDLTKLHLVNDTLYSGRAELAIIQNILSFIISYKLGER